MKTPTQAILWELWKTTRNELLAKLAFLCAILSFFALVPIWREFGEPHQRVLNGIAVVVAAICSSSMSTCWSQLDNTGNGFAFRLGFTRPIATRTLVLLPLAYTVVGSVLSYVLPVTLVNLFLPNAIPVLGPALLVAMLAALTLAATWSPASRAGRIACMIVTAACFVGLVFVRDSFEPSQEPLLMDLGRAEYYLPMWLCLLLPLVLLGTWALTTHRVALQRCGESNQLPSILNRNRRSRQLGSQRSTPKAFSKPFAKPWVAQLHYELQKSLKSVALIAAFLASAGGIFLLICNFVLNNAPNSLFVWLGMLLMSPIVFQIIATEGAVGIRIKQGTVQYPVYDATRPFTNDQLIAIKLLAIAIVSLLGWFVVALVAIPGTMLSIDSQTYRQAVDALGDRAGGTEWYWWIALLLGACLFHVASSSTLLAMGLWLPQNGKRLLVISGFLYLSLVLAFVDFTNKTWSLRWLWELYGWVFVLLVTYFLFRVSVQAIVSSSVARPLCWVSCCLWLGFAALMQTFVVDLLPRSAPTVVCMVFYSSLFVPLIAILATPVALASHRHA